MILIAVVQWACVDSGVSFPAPTSIVLISLDTLRRDRVGAYADAGRPSMQALESLSRESIIFESATTPIPFTLASHMTMMTGLYPDVHGVRRKDSVLAEDIPTLAEELKRLGFRTLGIYSNGWMEPKFGFSRGFDMYERAGLQLEIAPDIIRRALEILPAEAPQPGEPGVFLFLHFLDPHSDWTVEGRNTLPYFSPPKYRSEVAPDALDREYCSEEGRCATDLLLAHNASHEPLPETTRAKLEDLYDAGVRALDADIGAFLESLRARGYMERGAIIVLSDHGEEFWEHGQFLHNQIYPEETRIPLIIRLPGAREAGRRVSRAVETVDLLPTILKLAGDPSPPPSQGVDLLTTQQDSGPERAAFFVDRFVDSRFGLRTRSRSLIADLASGEVELYDRTSDPREEVNIAEREAGKVGELLDLLRERVRRNRALAMRTAASEKREPLSEETIQELKSLGYL